MQSEFAYDVPDKFRPSTFDITKIASRPWVGLTAYLANRPHLVIAYDGSEYTLEGENGDTLQLTDFVWDDENLSEENALVAASRIEGSPFEIGCQVDGQVIGKLAFDNESGEWSVTDTNGGSLNLLDLIDQLEAQGWQVEEAVDDFGLDNDYREAKTSCDDCDCDGENCSCDCHTKTALRNEPEDIEFGEPQKEIITDPLEAPKPFTIPEPEPEREPERKKEREPEKVPARAFSGSCEHCGLPYGEHTIDGLRCPSEREPIEAKVGAFDKTTDTNGNPLKPGLYYEMHSSNYKIPDTIHIVQITPDMIVCTTHEGSVTLTIKPDDLEKEGYSFEPLLAEGNADAVIESHFHHTARRRFSPSEQQELIDEPGVARNKHKMSLENSHYQEKDAAELDDDDFWLI